MSCSSSVASSPASARLAASSRSVKRSVKSTPKRLERRCADSLLFVELLSCWNRPRLRRKRQQLRPRLPLLRQTTSIQQCALRCAVIACPDQMYRPSSKPAAPPSRNGGTSKPVNATSPTQSPTRTSSRRRSRCPPLSPSMATSPANPKRSCRTTWSPSPAGCTITDTLARRCTSTTCTERDRRYRSWRMSSACSHRARRKV